MPKGFGTFLTFLEFNPKIFLKKPLTIYKFLAKMNKTKEMYIFFLNKLENDFGNSAVKTYPISQE